MAKSNEIPKKIYPHTFQKVKGVGVYLDCASGTEANPSSIHSAGVQARLKLEKARTEIAKVLSVRPEEIIFTSGGTESNNLAILGLIHLTPSPLSLLRRGVGERSLQHIVTTNIEHASVLEVCKYLERTKQAEVTYVEVEDNGIVDPKKIKKALRLNTVLVSVMYANNEIGTVQPIRKIAKEIRHYKKTHLTRLRHPLLSKERAGERFPVFHTDAVQAVNYLPIRIPELGVDLMSLNSAKIYGPKGIGALYVKKGTPLRSIMFGGNQEMGLRPGTENVASILEFSKALQTVEKIKAKEVKRLTKLRDYFLNKLKYSNILNNVIMLINGDLQNRLPNNVNMTIPKIPSDLLVIELSARGIMASAKSACKAGDGKASYVIQAINKNIKEEDGSLRFSLGRETTKADIDYTVKALSEILTKLKKWYN